MRVGDELENGEKALFCVAVKALWLFFLYTVLQVYLPRGWRWCWEHHTLLGSVFLCHRGSREQSLGPTSEATAARVPRLSAPPPAPPSGG